MIQTLHIISFKSYRANEFHTERIIWRGQFFVVIFAQILCATFSTIPASYRSTANKFDKHTQYIFIIIIIILCANF